MKSTILDNIISKLRDEIEDKQYHITEQIDKIKEAEESIDEIEMIIMKLEELI